MVPLGCPERHRLVPFRMPAPARTWLSVRRLSLLLPLFAALACSDPDPDPAPDAGSDAGAPVDGGPGADGGADTGPRPDGGTRPDASLPPVVINCPNDPIPGTGAETCSVQMAGSTRLVRGAIVAPEGLLENGHLLIDADGRVVCAGCDCSEAEGFAEATVIACPSGVVSPGLINPHEHLTFAEGSPIPTGDVRYDHRHEWRTGARGAMNLRTPSQSMGSDPVIYAELRHVLGGATAVAGAGGAPGLLRNLDRADPLQEGLGQSAVRYSTFPLGDSNGALRDSGCNYGGLDQPTDNNIQNALAYVPHISEGIDPAARNEFLCLSGRQTGGVELVLDKTAIIHGVGMNAVDYAFASSMGASLVWSPRTNISLYGMTAPITMARALGMNISLGTDWPSSGSQNMLRELACAAQFDDDNNGDAFTDRELVDMATVNAAAALKSDGRIGSFRPGLEADLAIFDATERRQYRAIIEGEPATVALVMRSGLPLYGDSATVEPLRTEGCDPLDVCGTQKLVCVRGETGRTVEQLQVRSGTIELFSCGIPNNEPPCIPFRLSEFTGIPTELDQDGDGVPDVADNCPTVFNPPRPLDRMGEQADADRDGLGDVCDPCPLDPDTTTCTPPDPNDRDGDGILNAEDNCPDDFNPDQSDRDMDGIGDVCDRCPDYPNPGDGPCLTRIYDIKRGDMVGAVRVERALVTAAGADGYFLQTISGDPDHDATLGHDFSGVFVFDRRSERPSPGDRVTVTGDVNVFFGQTQIAGSQLEVDATGTPLPDPLVVLPADVATGGARAAALEAVLLEVQNVVVTDAAPDEGRFGEFIVNDSLRVNNFLYAIDPFPIMGQGLGYIRGVLRFANSNFKLEPRGPADVDQAPVLLSLEPALAFAPENGPEFPLELRLNRPVDAPTPVNLSATGPVSVAGGVTVPMGADRVNVSVTPGLSAPVPAEVRATLGSSMVTAAVRVYGEAEPRTVATVELDAASVRPTESVEGTVTLDLPAPTGGTVVTFTVAPVGTATVAPVTLAAGSRQARFQVDAGSMEGAVAIGAVGSAAQASLTISALVSVLINEVYYDEPGPDGPLVFTELVGPPGTDLSGWELIGYARANGQVYRRVPLGGTIPARGLYVIGTAQATGDTLANRDFTGNIDWQNNESAVQLLDPMGQVIDAVQWGAHPNLMFGRGNPAPQTRSNQSESVSRDMAHTDTGDNATDFLVISPPTPGAP